MSYQVLARKWRPQHFGQLVGQDHVKNALGNALTNNRLHHAYLFTGTRGVGKTTIARIFAKSLNCEQGITPTPCGQCAACVEIDAGNFVDLLEIDAASRTKVEDTRDLLDNVQYAPSRGRFKVYLIDEVHMLSKHSFNALLKTLEEPPPHVKFLLATTDPQKLPVTVLSRCLQFNLLALSPTQIEQHLAYVLTAETVPFEPQALTLLARAAKGSLRDSLSLTDQAIAQSNANITLDVIRNMLGLLDQSWAQLLLQAILSQDVAVLQQQLAALIQQHSDCSQVLDDMLSILHLTALSQFQMQAAAISEQQVFIEQLATQLAPAQVQLYYQLLISGKKELPYAPDPLTGLEMALLRAMAFIPQPNNTNSGDLLAKTPPAAIVAKPVQQTPAAHSQPQSGSDALQPAEPIDVLNEPRKPADTLATAGQPSDVASAAVVVPATVSGIDAGTSGIMARRGIQIAAVERPAEKKPERPSPPPIELTNQSIEPTLVSHSKPVATLEPDHSAPTVADKIPTQPDVSDYVDEYDDTVPPEQNLAQTEALWQQYQAEAPLLDRFDGSINEQNFSIRFAAQVDSWAARVEQLDTGGLSRLFLLNAAMTLQGEQMTLTVAQSQQHLDDSMFRQKLQQVLEQSFGQSLQLHIVYQSDVADSPLAIQQKIVAERHNYVSNLLQTDTKVQQLQQLFDAVILPDTIQVN